MTPKKLPAASAFASNSQVLDPNARVTKQSRNSKSSSPAKLLSTLSKSPTERAHSPATADASRSKSPAKSHTKKASSPQQHGPKHYIVEERYRADLFQAATNHSLLIHACNCRGSWGGGIALAFAKKYPKAAQVYKECCARYRQDPKGLLGTALLIPPVDKDSAHWIGCLFTSVGTRANLDPPDKILVATKSSMKHLMQQVAEIQNDPESTPIKDIIIARINSVLFKVPWKYSRAVLEDPAIYVESTPEKLIMIERGEECAGDERE
jgi:ADP-ribose 1''-phosphate phosphatase